MGKMMLVAELAAILLWVAVLTWLDRRIRCWLGECECSEDRLLGSCLDDDWG